MHIVTFAYECGAFDLALMRSGTASLVWNTARALAEANHRVSIVTPAHGHADHLIRAHGAVPTGYLDCHAVPLVLDGARWPGFPATPPAAVSTRALHVRREGVDLYFLQNEFLNAYPGTFYPDPSDEGRTLDFLKPLIFQLDGIRFIREFLAGDLPVIVQAYEPLYSYLVPPAFAEDRATSVVATIATNHPVGSSVHRGQLAAALEFLGVDLALDDYLDPAHGDGALDRALRDYLPSTRLDQPCPPGYLGFLSLIVEHADAVDFLTEGQREFYTSFAGTPFEPRFRQLAVSRFMDRNAHKFFVGGCAITDSWFHRDELTVDRAEVLGEVGLDPQLPTFYHAARFAPHHKGQLELIRAVERVLDGGAKANFVIRCAVTAGRPVPADSYFQAVADRHRARLHLEWRMADEATLFAQSAASDYCLFPSKYELDTFLIAQGEAMACGAVPIATAQEGTKHFGHLFTPHSAEATGFAVARSFREDDPLLTAALTERIEEAIRLINDDPAEYARLSHNARIRARSFTWQHSARLRAERFQALAAGRRTLASSPPPATAVAVPQGRTEIRFFDREWSLVHTSPAAERVEVLLPDPARGGTAVPHPLQRDGLAFRATFPGWPPEAKLALLLTFPQGRFAWETIGTDQPDRYPG